MIARCSSIVRASFVVSSPLAAMLLMMSCSSPERSTDGSTDAGDEGRASPDTGVPSEAGGDAGNDAADANELEPPPPYDFAVKCAGDRCVTRIAARGGAHACVVLQDGSVRCWGANASGQLGTGSDDAGSMPAYEAVARQVRGISSATSVAATGDGRFGTSCVVSGAGEVACFGSDLWGQLGRGSGTSSEPHPAPAPVDGLLAKSVTFTNTFALGIGTDDRLWSWGTNDARQLARTTSGPDAGSATAAERAVSVSSSVRSCAGTSKTGFVVSEAGDLVSWGGGTSDQLGRFTSLARDPIPAPIAVSDVSSVTSGAAHACALGRGRVHCWGQNEHGQLGTGRKAEEALPARVLLPAGVYAVAVAAGGNNTCIIAANGDLYCWGANGGAQMGTSSGLDQSTPTRIDGLTEPTVAVAVMDESICGLLRGGSVACWGDNLFGQLGRGSRDTEVHVQPGPVVFE
ncbi:MAG: regulator of chromosome condensation [Labilithrix sp.]|nr:regulator of chromosome condensation [Labilithrix sp.]